VLTVVVVVTTVVINGMTMAPLMKFLKLTEVPEERQFMLQRAMTKLKGKTDAAISQLRDKLGSGLPDIQWEGLKGSALSHCVAASCTVVDTDKATWLLVLNMERAYYLHHFEAGSLGSRAYHVLETTMADICAEANAAPSSELGKVYDRLFYEPHGLLGAMKKMKASDAYEVGLAYLGAQHEVEHLTEKDANRAALSMVVKEHADNTQKMQAALVELRSKAPRKVAAFQERYVAFELLQKQRSMVTHMLHEGELLDLDAAQLLGEIDEEIAAAIRGKPRKMGSAKVEAAENYAGAGSAAVDKAGP